jgi:biopolymer transport protein ExbB/TolQ
MGEMLAQLATGAPSQKHVDGAFDVILAQGLLGAICILLTAALIVSLRGWLKEKDARREDRKEMSDALKEVNDSLRDLVIEGNKHSSNVVVDFNRSTDAMKNAAYNQEKAFEALRTSISALQQEQARIVALQNVSKR